MVQAERISQGNASAPSTQRANAARSQSSPRPPRTAADCALARARAPHRARPPPCHRLPVHEERPSSCCRLGSFLQAVSGGLDHRGVHHTMAKVRDNDGWRLLEQDLLAPLLKARQKKARARGDGPEKPARVEKPDAE